MKQTTIQFEKRKTEPVTIQRLQSVVDAVGKGTRLNKALREAKLSGAMGMHLVDARILMRLDGRNVVVFKPTIERKDFYKIMDLSSKHEKNLREKRKLMEFYEQKKSVTGYNQLQNADTDMLGLVNMPKIERVKLQRTSKPRAKKAVALPWWKRFLLYLANN